ncbi:MAG: GntR family transcriptional regulator [Gammaproteobacteria bacterium]|nr:GntR family transcriptional regulator [Gammaproteobacteria bacterium]
MASQQSRVTVQLREMILNGEFEPGQHLTELALARILGVSRTPIRYALGVIEQEGLVTGIPHRGFRVEQFSMQDIHDAIELRGVLEGMAARLVVERGRHLELVPRLRALVETGDRLLDGRLGRGSYLSEYDQMNRDFHAAIVQAAGNRALENALRQNDKLPFASAGAIALRDPQDIRDVLARGHHHHHALVEALEHGAGTRAEALMREHALIPKRSLQLGPERHDSGQTSLQFTGLSLV